MGDVISPYYDPMIAKLIVRGDDRDQARARMIQALAATQVVGVQTNVAFLIRLMRDEAFAHAELDTALIERRRATLLAPPAAAYAVVLALATAAVLVRQGLPQTLSAGEIVQASVVDPWDARDGWRLGNHYRQTLDWLNHAATRQVVVTRDGHTWSIDCGQGKQSFGWQAQPTEVNSNLAYKLHVTLDRRRSEGTVVMCAEAVHVFHDGAMHTLEGDKAWVQARDAKGDHGGGLTAPMPGKIISIAVQRGDAVKQGQPLVVMEAMKMEHTIMAPVDGKVDEVFYAVGDQVAEGAALISVL
jgi:3-methylcrotonyl-CoA carboxylase alpha subunit